MRLRNPTCFCIALLGDSENLLYLSTMHRNLVTMKLKNESIASNLIFRVSHTDFAGLFQMIEKITD